MSNKKICQRSSVCEIHGYKVSKCFLYLQGLYVFFVFLGGLLYFGGGDEGRVRVA